MKKIDTWWPPKIKVKIKKKLINHDYIKLYTYIFGDQIKTLLKIYATLNAKEPKNKNIHNTFELNAMKGKNTRMVATKD
jgi:hypothetical protein